MATDYGTAHLYGINGTFSNATISSQSFERTCANMGEVVNESGNVIERRYDDITEEGTLVLIQRSGTATITPGLTITVPDTSGTAEIVKVGRKQEARGFRILEVMTKSSAGITAYS